MRSSFLDCCFPRTRRVQQNNLGSHRAQRLQQSANMVGSSAIMADIAQQLGPKLYTACIQNHVEQIKALTSSMDTDKWSDAVLAAAVGESADVAAYCMQTADDKVGTTDRVLRSYVHLKARVSLHTSRYRVWHHWVMSICLPRPYA